MKTMNWYAFNDVVGLDSTDSARDSAVFSAELALLEVFPDAQVLENPYYFVAPDADDPVGQVTVLVLVPFSSSATRLPTGFAP